jgi:hypothetical protein
MKKNISAIINIVISAFLIVAVNTFLHPCEGEMAMPCNYNTRTAVMLLIVIIVASAAKLFVKDVRGGAAIGAVSVAAAIEIAIVPQFNRCEGMMMNCNSKTVPALLIGALLIIAVSVIFTVIDIITDRRK